MMLGCARIPQSGKACQADSVGPEDNTNFTRDSQKTQMNLKNKWLYIAAFAAMLFLTGAGHAQADGRSFQDPLDTPAVQQSGFRTLSQQPLMATAHAGHRIVAVGLRGLVIFSDDDGKSWRQARVPVQTDLVAVQFVTPTQGWASGHDAVILHTEDAGATWIKQFDNRLAAVVLPAYYQKKVGSGDTSMTPYLKQIELNTQGDTSLPFLSIYFRDLQHGFAVGSFGMIVATLDGGKHWLPWLDHIDNKSFLNLNAIRKIGNDLIIVGEQGGVYRYDMQADSFIAVSVPYRGSFFDIVGGRNFLLAFGLRGTAYRSEDSGVSWRQVDTSVTDSLVAGALLGNGGTIVLVTSSGGLIVSADEGLTFRPRKALHPMLFTTVSALGTDRVVLAGLQGIDAESLAVGRSSRPEKESQ